MARILRSAQRVAVVLLAPLLIVGCGGSASRSPGSPSRAATMPTAPTVYVETSCSMTAGNSLVVTKGQATRPTASATVSGPIGIAEGGAIPAGFAPVSAFRCGVNEDNVPGDGLWRVAYQSKADGRLDDLIAAYRRPAPAPSTPPGAQIACAAYADSDPVLAFVDALGTAIWPAAPRDPICHHISTRVTQAINALNWPATKGARVLHELTNGGCGSGYHYEDMLSLSPPKGTANGPTSGPYFVRRPKKQLTLCVFADGTFKQEITRTGADLDKAVATLDAAPTADVSCTQNATRFAILIGDADAGAGAHGDQDGYLELDGCRRLGQIDTGGPVKAGGVRQLTASDIAALIKPSP